VVYAVIFMTLLVIVVLTRHMLLKKEMRSIANQIDSFNSGVMEKKLDLSLFDKDLEELAGSINELMDGKLQAAMESRRNDNELKQAIANMSHDLRTPLTSILGYIQLLESTTTPADKYNEYVSIVRSTARRMQTLLNDFFELSIIDSPDHQLKREQVRMNPLLWDILAGLYDRFRERQLEPRLNILNEPVAIMADESAVRRVMENLVTNAIRHATGAIEVSLKKEAGSVLFIVRNEAANLSEQDVNRLFDRFYTADQTRTGRSTGLGLSIAHSLMHKMDAQLTASLRSEQLEMKCEWKL